MTDKKTVIVLAAELMKKNKNLKSYEAMEKARRELGEMDRRRLRKIQAK